MKFYQFKMFYLSRFYPDFTEARILINPRDGFINKKRFESTQYYPFVNINFKVWSEKRRSRGEPSQITNKMSHIMNGNRQSGDHLNICFTNVPGQCSPQNIEIAIKLVLNRYKPGVLGLAEPSYDILKEIYFPGYKLIKGKLSGGKKFRLNVLVKETLQDVKIESFTTDVPSLLLSAGGFKYLYFYREWNKDGVAGTDHISQQEERWESFIRRVKRIGGKLIILGDANVDYLSEETQHQKNLSNIREEMFGLLADRGYAQLVKEDTRHRGDQKGCLDHIYTGQLKYVDEIFNQNIHGWDHNSIGVRLRTDRPVFRRKVIVKRDYDRVNPDDFHRVWVQSNPQEIFETKDIERMIEILEFKIKHVLDILCPEKRFVTSENYAPWVDKQLKSEMKYRDRLRREAIEGKVPWTEHDKMKHKVKDELKKAERAWKEKYLNFEDEKQGWHRLKEVSGLTEAAAKKIALMIDGELVDDPETLSKYINEYFIEKINKITAEFPPKPIEAATHAMEYLKDKNVGKFKFQTASYSFVKRVTMKLNNVDSTGMDGIPVKVYKKFRSSLTPAITKIINSSIKTSIYPQRFKDGCISPVPKKGDLSLVSNWRPVVLLPVMSRILEGVLMTQMMNYLEDRELIPPTQHAYRRRKSCITAWEDIDVIINRARDEGKACGMLMTDLAGAFNCVSKLTLLPTLRMAGFNLESIKLLESYLSNRSNCTRVESSVSIPLPVPTGVGEGSSSGPILWLCHILTSPGVIRKTESILEDYEDDNHPATIPIIRREHYQVYETTFADDCNNIVVARTNKEVLDIMAVLQDQYSDYFSNLGLKESRAKQQHIIWSKKKEKGNEFLLNGRKGESSIKLLGIICSDSYTFEKQAASVAGRIAARLPHLRRIRDHVSRDVLIRVSTALALSILQYGVEIWCQKISLQRKLQKIVNMLLRILTNKGRDANVASMMMETGILNVHLTYQYFAIMSLERLIETKGSSESVKLILWNHDRIIYQTRVKYLRLNWRPKTASGWQCFMQQSCKYYNALGLWYTNWFSEPDAGKRLKEDLIIKYGNKNL